MSSRLAVVAGLVSGVIVAGALLVALVALGPDVRSGGDSSPSPSPPAGASSSPAVSAPPPSGSGPATSPSGSPSGSAPPGAFHIGDVAPPLALPQVGGGTVDLAALKGKPVWVNFMATWCPPCIDEFPLMNGFAARYADDGLVVIAIDVEEDEGTVEAFAERLDPIFPIGLDADGAAQEAWGAHALPVHFWIDAEGIVRDGALGGIGPDVMASGLQAILPGVEVTP